MRFVLRILVSLMALAVIISCQQHSETLPIVRIGHAPHDHHSSFYIAAMNPDFFKANGGVYLKERIFRKEYVLYSGERPLAQVLIDSGTGGKELIRQLSEGYFDISFGGFPAMLHFIDQGSSIKIISPVMSQGAGLVVRNDLPINNWSEFVDHVRHRKDPLKIGYKMAVSVQNLIFEQALRETGIPHAREIDDPQAKIILLNLYGAGNLIPALRDGLIDGFVVMQPFIALAEEKRAGKVVSMLSDLPPPGKWKGHPCCALAANVTYLQAHPEITETFLTLLMRATLFLANNPAESASQIGRWLDMPATVEEKSLQTILFTTEFSDSWDRGVGFWVESMMESGMLSGKIKQAYQQNRLEELIYNRELYKRAKANL